MVTSFFDKSAHVPKGVILTKLLVLYGIIVVISASSGYNPEHSFTRLSDYFNWLVIYVAIVRTVTTRARFFLFFTLYMLCNVKMTQHGFISWAQRGFSFAGYGVTGAPGWFQNSGEFGIQLCIFTPLIVAFILAVKPYCGRGLRMVLYVIPITAVGSAVASSSRGALLGLAACSLWSFRTTKHFFRTAVLLVAGVWAVYSVIPEESMNRFRSSGTDRTSLVRLDRWQKGWDTMKAHPILGVGHKNWEQYYIENLNYGEPGTVLVHNLFIESGTEHGFLGLGTLVLTFLSMFAVNAKTRKLATAQQDKFSIYVAHGLDAGIVGLAISGSFVTVLYYPYVWIHAAFVAALHVGVRYGSLQAAHRLR